MRLIAIGDIHGELNKLKSYYINVMILAIFLKKQVFLLNMLILIMILRILDLQV